MREVHDIWQSTNPDKPWKIVAFIQHGNDEEGFDYEVICPYCGDTVDVFEDDDELYPDRSFLFQKMLKGGMADHIVKCAHVGSHKLQVVKATHALNTTKRYPKES